MIRLLAHIIIIAALTITTQVGGIAWLAAVVTQRGLVRRVGTFMVAYAALWVGASWNAPAFGRQALPCFVGQEAVLKVKPIYCLLNRHYATPEAAAVAQELAAHLDQVFPGTRTVVLDANFPFLDGFPLLPHLSHDDGRKVDLAFFYRDEGGYLRDVTRSPLGYFAFDSEGVDCPPVAVTMRWDLAWLQPLFRQDLTLDAPRNAEAVRWLTESPHVEAVRRAAFGRGLGRCGTAPAVSGLPGSAA
ncbi:hypothetical protein [Halovulum sp. GXIMD14793]